MEDDGNGISKMDNNIHNWYELVVFDKLSRIITSDENLSQEQLSDIACVTLNHLPLAMLGTPST
ncbi:MAG: hypothetical protein ACI9CE_000043 [Flavobacterium sp.]|jgi:hypothetical protein